MAWPFPRGNMGRISFDFAEIFSQAMKAANAAGTHNVDGYEITVCYFGPPVAFYPRLLVIGSLSITTVAVFKRSFPRNTSGVIGLTGALSAYIYWWIQSYRVFLNFTDAGIHFLNNGEIRQAAYLYGGTWLDICVALSVFVCLVLLLDRLLNQRRLVSSVGEPQRRNVSLRLRNGIRS
jgi:hypothetical protein